MNAGTLAFGLFPERNALIVADLLNGTGNARFVTFDVMARNEDVVTEGDLTGLEEGDITDKKLPDINSPLNTGADDLDTTLLLLVEDA